MQTQNEPTTKNKYSYFYFLGVYEEGGKQVSQEFGFGTLESKPGKERFLTCARNVIEKSGRTPPANIKIKDARLIATDWEEYKKFWQGKYDESPGSIDDPCFYSNLDEKERTRACFKSNEQMP